MNNVVNSYCQRACLSAFKNAPCISTTVQENNKCILPTCLLLKALQLRTELFYEIRIVLRYEVSFMSR